ncbi:MAG: sulfotransferase domain-containing protein [Candidatus Parabeggiatoa sp. nov. 1]|nr:MAG: sulfotransferase domain-containing protein [Gammaproteobacteria bacterium]
MLIPELYPNLPKKEYIYNNHVLNSSAWDHYKPRVGDVIIVTALKAGTTWMQGIVGNLIFQNPPMPAPVWKLSLWLDRRLSSVEETLQLLEAQTHRRFIKTHLPMNALPYFPEVQYIYVGRDGRDVFMSLWNHHYHLAPEVMEYYNAFLAPRNQSVSPCTEDIHEFFAQWIEKSWFPWENEGFPYWSPFYHLHTWWSYRHLPNILFVHFNDLLSDLEGEMRRIADYLKIPSNEAFWPELVANLVFESMKANADAFVPNRGRSWKGGVQRFLNKGTNGRWQGVLTEEELRQYEAAVNRQLTPESKRWLELGAGSSLAHSIQ